MSEIEIHRSSCPGSSDRGGYRAKYQRSRGDVPVSIYSKWFSEYSQAHPNVKINYQSVGSGGGIRRG